MALPPHRRPPHQKAASSSRDVWPTPSRQSRRADIMSDTLNELELLADRTRRLIARIQFDDRDAAQSREAQVVEELLAALPRFAGRCAHCGADPTTALRLASGSETGCGECDRGADVCTACYGAASVRQLDTEHLGVDRPDQARTPPNGRTYRRRACRPAARAAAAGGESADPGPWSPVCRGWWT
jgi:hypothetical protein